MTSVQTKISQRDVVVSVAEKAICLEIQNLESDLSRAKEVLERLRGFSAKRPLQYKVKLVSMWEQEGEQSITHKHKGKLDTAIQAAERAFAMANQRSDFQARYFVWLVLTEARKPPVEILLPDVVWRKYTAKG